MLGTHEVLSNEVQEDDQPCNSLHFRHEVTLPNVYGQGEEEDEDIDERIREPDYGYTLARYRS